MMKLNIRTKLCGAVAMATALFIGAAPMTAFAGGLECTCEDKCSADHVNEECELCKQDFTLCCGDEKEEENWGPLTPDGNMTLVDDYGSMEAGGKQFITVVTKDGNYFYIIIDRDDEGQETVHFLNMVDEADLLSLMDEDEVKNYIALTQGSGDAEKTEEKETVTEPAPTKEEPEETTEPENTEEKKGGSVNGIMAIILVVAVGGIAGFFYLKSKKSTPSQQTGPDPDADYEDEDILDSLEDEEDVKEDDE